ncbi:hypothetical protein EDB80DRAFT_826485 [Ilyonectria destructans]|nr:hypothetical protein EDB80DRAFT_826485 [Ilyonectria destructans]
MASPWDIVAILRTSSAGFSDVISITSTVEEEPNRHQEYSVRDILAEREVDGKTEYLIYWTDSPLYDSSWEPKENVDQVVVHADWEKSKQQESHHYKSRLAVETWIEAVENRIHDKMNRHDVRNQLRVKLGLELTIYEQTRQEYLDDFRKELRRGKYQNHQSYDLCDMPEHLERLSRPRPSEVIVIFLVYKTDPKTLIR